MRRYVVAVPLLLALAMFLLAGTVGRTTSTVKSTIKATVTTTVPPSSCACVKWRMILERWHTTSYWMTGPLEVPLEYGRFGMQYDIDRDGDVDLKDLWRSTP